MRFQDIRLQAKDACPVCGADIRLTEVEPHPFRNDWVVYGYSCEKCGPIKSLVVQRPVYEGRKRAANS